VSLRVRHLDARLGRLRDHERGENGVLIKGGNHLEAMGEVDAVALDKTGTLTKGKLTVTDLVPLGDADEATLLRRAAALERRSEHPIASAILDRADRTGVTDHPEPAAFESPDGEGDPRRDRRRDVLRREARAVRGPRVRPVAGTGGDRRRVVTEGDDADPPAGDIGPREFAEGTLAALEREGKTVVLVGTATQLTGAIAIADEVRRDSKRAVERLRELGVKRVVMLTGDNEGTARAIAEQTGVDEYRAELLPEEKVEAVRALQAEYGDVAMVGDGINDAPALAAAEVGVAMGAAGTDTALETADIALMGDDVAKLPYLYALSHTANGVIRQNVWASLGVKALLALGVPLGLVSVAVAVVVGDMGMSLGVTGNAMRLSGIEPESFE